jgi:YNFM family putative membrane transporter
VARGLAAVGVLALVLRRRVPSAAAAADHGADPTPQRVLRSHLGLHLRDPGVRRLCLSSFVLMAGFVTVYNFLGYRLLEPPFGLSQLLVGLVFVSYLAGTLTRRAPDGSATASAAGRCCSAACCWRWPRCCSR